jgi:hypothetical protein
MTSERALLRIAFCALAALAGACADFSRGPAPAGVDGGAGEAGEGGPASPDAAASFATDVHGILTGSCMRCHSDGGEASDTAFLLTGDAAADLETTTRFIDVNAPAASRLLAKMSGNGHGGGTVHAAGTPEYETVLRWIQEGARP